MATPTNQFDPLAYIQGKNQVKFNNLDELKNFLGDINKNAEIFNIAGNSSPTHYAGNIQKSIDQINQNLNTYRSGYDYTVNRQSELMGDYQKKLQGVSDKYGLNLFDANGGINMAAYQDPNTKAYLEKHGYYNEKTGRDYVQSYLNSKQAVQSATAQKEAAARGELPPEIVQQQNELLGTAASILSDAFKKVAPRLSQTQADIAKRITDAATNIANTMDFGSSNSPEERAKLTERANAARLEMQQLIDVGNKLGIDTSKAQAAFQKSGGSFVSNADLASREAVGAVPGGPAPTPAMLAAASANGFTQELTAPNLPSQPVAIKGQEDLASKVMATNGTVNANQNFVNAVFKAYHGRDATQAELDQFTGKQVSQVRDAIIAGSPQNRNIQSPQGGDQSLIQRVEATDGTKSANANFVNAVFKAYQGRDATQAELDRLTGKSVDEVRTVGQGFSSDPTYQVDSSGGYNAQDYIGSGGASDLKALEGLAGAGSNPDAFVASLKGLDGLFASTASPELLAMQRERTSLLQGAQDAATRLEGKGAALAAELGKQGVTGFETQLADLQMEIAQKEAQYNLGQIKIEGQPIPMDLITGQTSQLKRQQAVEMGLLYSKGAWLQGRIELGQKIAQQVVDMKFAEDEQKIANTQMFLELNKDAFSAEEAKQAAKIEFLLNERASAIADKKSEANRITELMQNVVSAGGSINGMSLDKSFVENLRAASLTLSDVGKTTKGNYQLVQDGSGNILGVFDKDYGEIRSISEVAGDPTFASMIGLNKQLDQKQIGQIEKSTEAKQLLAMKDLENKLAAYKTLVTETKDQGFDFFGPRRATMDSLYADLKIAYKTAAELGALTGPDVAIISEAIKPMSGGPMAFFTYLTSGRSEGVLSSIDAAIGSAGQKSDIYRNSLLSKWGEYASDPYMQNLIEPSEALKQSTSLRDAYESMGVDVPFDEAIKQYGESGLRQILQKNGVDFNNVGTDTNAGANLQSLKQSIIQQESGGNYKAVGAMTKYGNALGKYQIIPQFHFSKIGLKDTPADRQKYLNSPILQDKLFAILIDELATKYNNDPAKIAAAYYGGGGGAQVVGTKAGDKPQAGGHPSINAYVKSVLSRINTTG